MEWSESDLAAWMNAVNITAYLRHFQAGGVVRGCDLQGLDDAGLFELGITDELHRQIIMECLDELRNGTSSRVSGESYAKPLSLVTTPPFSAGMLVSYHATPLVAAPPYSPASVLVYAMPLLLVATPPF